MTETETTAMRTVRPAGSLPGWRRDAARLAAELLCVVKPDEADQALDLRTELLDAGTTPERLLRVFLAARNGLERSHYLLFYRLRRVLEPAVGLEIREPGKAAVRRPVDFRFRSADHLLRRARHERFEQSLDIASPDAVDVAVIWRLAPAEEPVAP